MWNIDCNIVSELFKNIYHDLILWTYGRYSSLELMIILAIDHC